MLAKDRRIHFRKFSKVSSTVFKLFYVGREFFKGIQGSYEFGSLEIVFSDFSSHLLLHFSSNFSHVTCFSFKDSIDSMTYLTSSPVSFFNKALLFGSFTPQKKANPKHFLFYDRSKSFTNEMIHVTLKNSLIN